MSREPFYRAETDDIDELDLSDQSTPPPIINADPAPIKVEPVGYYQTSSIGPATPAKPESSSEHGTPRIKDEQHDKYSMTVPNLETSDVTSKIYETSASLQKLVHDTNEDASVTAQTLEAGAQQGLLLLDQL